MLDCQLADPISPKHQRVASSRLTAGTVLCPLARHIILPLLSTGSTQNNKKTKPNECCLGCKYILKRLSFGSKDSAKELKLECAYFLGQTSLFLPIRLHQ